MFSIGRLIKAEFIKTFKKPTVYIMALILVVVALVSLFIFDPAHREDNRIYYPNKNTGADVYSEYMSSGPNTKESIDALFSNTDAIILYHNNLIKRNEIIVAGYNNILTTFNDFESTQTLEDRNLFANAINDYKSSLTSINGLENISYLNTSITQTFFINIIEEISNYHTFVTGLPLRTPETIINDFNSSNRTKMFTDAKDTATHIINSTINYHLSEASKAYQSIKEMGIKHEFNVGSINTQNELNYLNSYIEELITNPYVEIYFSNDNYELYTTTYQNYVTKLVTETYNNTETWSTRLENLNKIASHNFVSTIASCTDSIIYANVSKNIVTDLQNIQTKVNSNKLNITNNIENYKDSDTTNEILENITNYSLLSTTYSNLVDNVILQNTTNNLSTNEIRQLYGNDFENFNKYQLNQNITLDRYKISTNIYGQNHLNGFNFNVTSGYEENGYDYMFFSLSIITIAITIFAIMMTCTTLGSEQDSGTIKLLLVRPYSRTKILLSKLLSVFIFICIFTLFSAITTIIAGWASFGFDTGNVLTVFNASSVMNIHPMLLIFIYLITIIFQVSFYTSIAFALSVIFKSFATSLVSSIIVYMGAITTNILLSKSVAYYFIPFTNSYLFRYFTGMFNLTSMPIFVSPIYSTMTFVSSILISTIFMLIIHLVAFIVFKRRDF